MKPNSGNHKRSIYKRKDNGEIAICLTAFAALIAVLIAIAWAVWWIL